MFIYSRWFHLFSLFNFFCQKITSYISFPKSIFIFLPFSLKKKGSLFDNPKMEFITYRWVWHSPCFKLPNQSHKFVLISWMMNEFITSEAKCFQSYKCNTNHFLNWKKQAFIFFLDLEKAELVARFSSVNVQKRCVDYIFPQRQYFCQLEAYSLKIHNL